MDEGLERVRVKTRPEETVTRRGTRKTIVGKSKHQQKGEYLRGFRAGGVAIKNATGMVARQGVAYYKTEMPCFYRCASGTGADSGNYA